MSLAKVIEVIGEGDTMEKAMEQAVKEASKTIHNIRGIYMEHAQGLVEGGRIVRYRVNAKITFVLDEA